MHRSPECSGVLVIDKPAGPTSHDVVTRVRRALEIRRIGHTGTLDPLATGVLPLVVERATRLAQFVAAAPKTYDASIRLGAATDTYDALGRLLPGRANPALVSHLRPHEVEAAVGAFRGSAEQLPPPFSAKKVEGRRAYALARRHQPVTPRPARVTVHAIEIVAFEENRLRLRMTTSAGFYVRSLADDLGVRLGCGAYLESLRRERSGGFGLEDAVALEVIEQEGLAARNRIVPLAELLPDLPAVVLTERGLRRVVHGNPVGPAEVDSALPLTAMTPAHPPAPRVRLFDRGGALVAVADVGREGVLRPRVVLV